MTGLFILAVFFAFILIGIALEITIDARDRRRHSGFVELELERVKKGIAELKSLGDSFDGWRELREFIDAQRRWSLKTLGPGKRTKGITAHIELELEEIRKAPEDLAEWIDVMLLAIDGAHRIGYSAHQIIEALQEKQRENFLRTWPAPKSEDEPAEHTRTLQKLRACEKCKGDGPCLWDSSSGRYLCRACHSEPGNAFFLRPRASSAKR